MTLKRLNDLRVAQYWDKDHLVSKSIAEQDDIVWDYVAVYEPGKTWEQAPPEPAYSKAPVIHGIDGTREAIQKLLPANVK
jgi:hypothetical protein